MMDQHYLVLYKKKKVHLRQTPESTGVDLRFDVCGFRELKI
jgi:hypothetical protein